MRETLSCCKVAILTANGFNHRHLWKARERLTEMGAITTVVSSTREDLVCSWHPFNKGFDTAVDRHVRDVHPAYDALFLPGTVVDPDAIFVDPGAADFVKSFFDLGRPIASLCRDRWLFVHGNKVCSGRLKPEPSLPSEIVLPQSAPPSSSDRRGSYEDLDGVVEKMLAFFRESLAQRSPTSTSCVVAPDLDRSRGSVRVVAGDMFI